MGGFITPVTSVDTSSIQKISKATEIPNDRIDLTDTFRTLLAKTDKKSKHKMHFLYKCARNDRR